jgi:hypothetical protein
MFSSVLPSFFRRRHTKQRLPRRRLELEQLESREVLAHGPGTWTALSNLAPAGLGTMMLLTDGTVLATGSNTQVVNTWYKLTPDANGSYVNGTWTQLANSNTARLYTASNVLQSGKVFVMGGEYTDQGQVFSNTGEIYNPMANTWTPIATFPNSQFGDDPSQLLPDGRVLTGFIGGPQTYIYNPNTDTWTQTTGSKLNNDQSDEETWVKLPDNSILSYSVFASITAKKGSAQRYVPSSDSWVATGPVPVLLSNAAVGEELGPGFLMPSGSVFQLGANGKTAFYNPTTNRWTAGFILPGKRGADDAPGAMMPNGDILFAADHPLFNGTTTLFELDTVANKLFSVPTPSGLTGQLTGAAYTDRMLMLPNGQVLFTTGSNQLWAYTPQGGPQSSWQPVIDSVTNNNDGTYSLAGTQITGISEGAVYGDDAEMSTNYPIVQLQDSSGKVYYARTTNWDNTGVQTGATVEHVTFTLPVGLPNGTYNLFTIANGIASNPVSFTFGPAARPSATTTSDPSLVNTAGNWFANHHLNALAASQSAKTATHPAVPVDLAVATTHTILASAAALSGASHGASSESAIDALFATL